MDKVLYIIHFCQHLLIKFILIKNSGHLDITGQQYSIDYII